MQRCFGCNKIKSADLFFNKYMCLECQASSKLRSKKTEICINCRRKVSKVNQDQLCRKCAALQEQTAGTVRKTEQSKAPDVWRENTSGAPTDCTKSTAANIQKETKKKIELSRKTNISARMKKIKKDMVQTIKAISQEIYITEIPGFEEIDITNLTENDLYNNYSIEELATLLSAVEYLYNRNSEMEMK